MSDLLYDAANRDIVFVGDEVAAVEDGLQDYLQQMQLRWLTERGELVHYPDFGTIIYGYLTKSLSPSRISEIQREAREVCMQDRRTEAVHDVQVIEDEQSLRLDVLLRALGRELRMELVFAADGDGVDMKLEVVS